MSRRTTLSSSKPRNYDAGSKLTLRSKVRWVRNTGFNTYVGLSFINASLPLEALTRLVA